MVSISKSRFTNTQKRPPSRTLLLLDLDDTLTKGNENTAGDIAIPVRTTYVKRKNAKPDNDTAFWRNASGHTALNYHCQTLKMLPENVFTRTKENYALIPQGILTPLSETPEYHDCDALKKLYQNPDTTRILAMTSLDPKADGYVNQVKPYSDQMFDTLFRLHEQGKLDLTDIKKITFLDDKRSGAEALIRLHFMIKEKLGITIPVKFTHVHENHKQLLRPFDDAEEDDDFEPVKTKDIFPIPTKKNDKGQYVEGCFTLGYKSKNKDFKISEISVPSLPDTEYSKPVVLR